MRRYTAAEARARLSDALDHAEGGTPVVIERRGVRFQLARVPDRSTRRSTSPLVHILDPAVERGEWTWAVTRGGWQFSARRRRRRR